ncbi:MAG: hypothetical protein HXX09_09915 [Bacteroidetes bacterium]|nr:hypothetical protein [Bacteroidota bacterium]
MKLYMTSPCFDDMGKVLEKLMLPYSKFEGNFDCNILFLNCGTCDNVDSEKLKQFVLNGGILYASDQTATLVNSAFPEYFNFDFKAGRKQTVKAEIVDKQLYDFTGRFIDINFDLMAWEVLKSISKGSVILKSTETGFPLMVEIPHGKGKIFYTCFHNHAQANEKESALLKLLALKLIASSKSLNIKDVCGQMNINPDDYRSLFGQTQKGSITNPTDQPVQKIVEKCPIVFLVDKDSDFNNIEFITKLNVLLSQKSLVGNSELLRFMPNTNDFSNSLTSAVNKIKQLGGVNKNGIIIILSDNNSANNWDTEKLNLMFKETRNKSCDKIWIISKNNSNYKCFNKEGVTIFPSLKDSVKLIIWLNNKLPLLINSFKNEKISISPGGEYENPF